MKISVAQTRPIKGDIPGNVEKHKQHIEVALKHKAEAIFFPELSLTGYEPNLAKELATDQNDNRLDALQEISNAGKLTIAAGLPTISDNGVKISLIVFQPGKARLTYSKQYLHADELPFFISGDKQVILRVGGKEVAPAICYESLQLDHFESAKKLGAEIYVASVAKSQNGINKGNVHYPHIAKQFAIPVLMANCVGFCDTFQSVGNSSVWTAQGILKAQLDDESEGVIIFDTETEEVITEMV